MSNATNVSRDKTLPVKQITTTVFNVYKARHSRTGL